MGCLKREILRGLRIERLYATELRGQLSIFRTRQTRRKYGERCCKRGNATMDQRQHKLEGIYQSLSTKVVRGWYVDIIHDMM